MPISELPLRSRARIHDDPAPTRKVRSKSRRAAGARREPDGSAALAGRVRDLERELVRREREAAEARGANERAELVHRSILAAVLDPTLTIDARGRIVSASKSVERVFGWRAEELVGKNIKMLMPEPHRSRHDGYLANYARTGRTNILGLTREFEVVAKDGRRIEVELSVARVDVPGDERALFTGSFRDVSPRKRAEALLRESEARFHAIFDQSFEYIG